MALRVFLLDIYRCTLQYYYFFAIPVCMKVRVRHCMAPLEQTGLRAQGSNDGWEAGSGFEPTIFRSTAQSSTHKANVPTPATHTIAFKCYKRKFKNNNKTNFPCHTAVVRK